MSIVARHSFLVPSYASGTYEENFQSMFQLHALKQTKEF